MSDWHIHNAPDITIAKNTIRAQQAELDTLREENERLKTQLLFAQSELDDVIHTRNNRAEAAEASALDWAKRAGEAQAQLNKVVDEYVGGICMTFEKWYDTNMAHIYQSCQVRRRFAMAYEAGHKAGMERAAEILQQNVNSQGYHLGCEEAFIIIHKEIEK